MQNPPQQTIQLCIGYLLQNPNITEQQMPVVSAHFGVDLKFLTNLLNIVRQQLRNMQNQPPPTPTRTFTQNPGPIHSQQAHVQQTPTQAPREIPAPVQTTQTPNYTPKQPVTHKSHTAKRKYDETNTDETSISPPKVAKKKKKGTKGKEEEESPLKKLRVDELRQLCIEKGIEEIPKKKEDLLRVLNDYYAQHDPSKNCGQTIDLVDIMGSSLVNVVQYLEISDLARLTMVNKSWNTFFMTGTRDFPSDVNLWKMMVEYLGPSGKK